MPRTNRSSTAPLDRARWEGVLDTVQDAVVSIDEKGSILLFNRSAEKIFGYTPEEALGRNVNILMPSPYHEEHDGYIERYRQTGDARAIGRIRRVHGLRKSGEVFPIELSVSEARAGSRVVYTAIVRDVSERHRFEEELREERDFVQGLLDTAHTIILVLDPEGRIVLFNRFLEELSGWPLEEVRGKDWFSTFLPEGERERSREIFTDLVATGHLEGFVNRIGLRDGTERPIEWYATVRRSPHGGVSGIVGVGLDISERRRAEAELEETRRQVTQRERLADLGALAARIVHDVGNPLTAISLQAQTLLSRAARKGEEPLRSVSKPLERIHTETRRLEGLVRDLLTFARDQRIALAEVGAHEFLEEVAEAWVSAARERNVHVSVRLDDAVDSVWIDPAQLRRVFDNLVKNALEAMEKPGRITLRACAPSPGQIRLSVEDSGPGLPPDLRLFHLFETRKPGGSGLGLAISRQIVEAHSGSLTVEAAHPQGTIFHVSLPARPGEPPNRGLRRLQTDAST